jgi:NAD(P)-dependent dehydrogenase (short-subunit alcohol dehydrogenase family)
MVMKIVIAAASGNIGRRTAEKVIQAGAETVLLAGLKQISSPNKA